LGHGPSSFLIHLLFLVESHIFAQGGSQMVIFLPVGL
jgi:hypothetical protein